MSKTKLYVWSAILFVLAAAFLLAVSELVVRYLNLRDATETRDHLIEASYMPAKTKAHYQGRIWNMPFSTNQYGLRDEEDFSREPAAGECRVLSLGDSIAFGLGIESSAHYSKLLEKELQHNDATRRYRVVNASGPGYSPSCYYVYLRHEGLTLGPRLVIIEIEPCNDITDEALLHWEVDSRQPDVPARVRGGRYIIGWDGNLLATYARGPYFYENTYVYTVLTRRVLNLLYRFNPSEPFGSQPGVAYYNLGFDRYLLNQTRIESGWTRTFGALRGTHQLLRDHGVSFLLLIVPTRYMFDPRSGDWGTFSRALVERAVREAQHFGLPYLDLTDSMAQGGGARLYFDFAHPTAEGNRVIADALAAHLRNRRF